VSDPALISIYATKPPGVIIVAGLGSLAYGINTKGKEERIGGWGEIMGDEGSSPYIGRLALQAVASAFDGRGPKTTLTGMVCAKLKVVTAEELHVAIYAPGFNTERRSEISDLVIKAAINGDLVARRILIKAGHELGLGVAAVIQKLGMQDEVFQIAYIGNVFKAGNLILNALRDTISETAPNAYISPPIFSPAIGAAKIAMTYFEYSFGIKSYRLLYLLGTQPE
jgi:N-acetylglucosamine kinase-like BadF-type ATPase